MPTYSSVKENPETESIDESETVYGENTQEGQGSGAGASVLQSQKGNSTLRMQVRDISYEQTIRLEPISLQEPARATGLGTHGVAAAAAVEAANGGGGQSGSQVVYMNKGAIRDERLTPDLESDFKEVGNEFFDGRYDTHVFSGGQNRATGRKNRPGGFTGGPRHNFGGAGDVSFWDKQYVDPVTGKVGRYLDMRNGEDQAVMYIFAREMTARGWQGQGGNEGAVKKGRNYYMGPTRLHIGGGTPAVWGHEDGKWPAPDWLVRANLEGRPRAKPRGLLGGYQGGNYANHMISVDEAAKVQGPRATVASAVGFGGAQKNPTIARAYSETINARMGHKPVNWLAKNGPGMAGWESFLQSGPGIANGFLSPHQHLQAWVLGWFRAYPNIGNQIWKGAAGFNTLTNPEDLIRQIVNGGNYTHILNSYLGGFGMGGGGSSKGSGGSGGAGGAYKPDAGKEWRNDGRPEEDDELAYFIDKDKLDSEGALIRASVIDQLDFASGLRDGLNCCVSDYIGGVKNYPELVTALYTTGMINPYFARR